MPAPTAPNPGLVECPQCETMTEATPVTVLRPGDEALHNLFNGTLNQVTCRNCGMKFALAVPVVFRNDDAQYLIHFFPLPGVDAWKEAEEKMAEMQEGIFGEEDFAAPEVRLVTTSRDFVEKIAIHLRGLDDRLVEYVKYQLLNHPDKNFGLDPIRHKLLFDFSQDEDENLSFLVFDRETDKATARTHLPLESYKEILEMLSDPELNEELRQLFPGAYVSIDRLV